MVFQALCDQGLLGNQLTSSPSWTCPRTPLFAYQMKYDSSTASSKHDVKTEKRSATLENLTYRGQRPQDQMRRPVKDLATLPWKALGVDIVIESTGCFTDSEKAESHITGVPRKSSSPRRKGEVKTIVMASTKAKMMRQSTTSIPRLLHHELPRAALHVILKEVSAIETGLDDHHHADAASRRPLTAVQERTGAAAGRRASKSFLPPPARPGRGEVLPSPRASSRHGVPHPDGGRLGR